MKAKPFSSTVLTFDLTALIVEILHPQKPKGLTAYQPALITAFANSSGNSQFYQPHN
ncbi:MAG: hypothetical protein KatS3mg056_0048 [Chloroflexus sp.]|nr:MAG: hypothetical protein KatS3mg056_0048 [Chloroflexus sp.]